MKFIITPSRARSVICRSLVATLAACALSAAAADIPLTLAQAQQLAVQRSRQLTAQDYAADAAREMAVAAGQLPDPVLKIGVDNLPVNGPDRLNLTSDFMTMRRVGLMQEITRADKRQLRAGRFELEAEKSLAEKNQIAAAIERDTALAWLERYYAEAMLLIVNQQIQQGELEIQAAEGAYRGGRGNQADIFAAQSALTGLKDRASEIILRIRNAKTMLARWTDGVPDQRLAQKPDTSAISTGPAAHDNELAHPTQLAVLAMTEEIAKIDARIALANQTPDWSVELAYQQRGPGFANMVSVGLSLPLQWDRNKRQDRELSSRLAQVEQTGALREEGARMHVAEVRLMINEWENKRQRQDRLERELTPQAEERLRVTGIAYQGGKSSLAELLAARRNTIDVRLQILQLEAEAGRLWAQINFQTPAGASAAHANEDAK